MAREWARRTLTRCASPRALLLLVVTACAPGCSDTDHRGSKAPDEDSGSGAEAAVEERPYTIEDAVEDGALEADFATMLDELGDSPDFAAWKMLAPDSMRANLTDYMNAPLARMPRCSEHPKYDVRAVGAIIRREGTKTFVLCSATALSPTSILTARHCVTKLGGHQWYFTTDHLAKKADLVYRLQRPRVYPYNALVDLGVMDMAPAMNLPTNAYPKLSSTPPNIGNKILKVGYGYWTNPSQPIPIRSVGTKTCGIMSVKPRLDTTPVHRYDYDPVEPPGGQICDRDSGGPALYRNVDLYLIGVTKSTWVDLRHDKDCGTGGSDTQIPSSAGELRGVLRRAWIASETGVKT